MSTATIHRAYNDVVASHYDLDPQGVIGRSLDQAVQHLESEGLLDEAAGPLRILDIGMGTGQFLAGIGKRARRPVEPYGIDLAENMVEAARAKMPNLEATVGDAAELDAYFPGQTFDCICTHFVTGYVPMRVVGPRIADRLRPGGYWSLVGGTKAAYPALQAKGDSKLLRWLSGAGSRAMDDTVLNPANLREATAEMESHGFEIRTATTFEPTLDFRDFDQFMEFGYRGGWLTPLIESMGLHRAGPFKRWLIDRLAFPVKDSHNIVIVMGRKR